MDQRRSDNFAFLKMAKINVKEEKSKPATTTIQEVVVEDDKHEASSYSSEVVTPSPAEKIDKTKK